MACCSQCCVDVFGWSEGTAANETCVCILCRCANGLKRGCRFFGRFEGVGDSKVVSALSKGGGLDLHCYWPMHLTPNTVAHLGTCLLRTFEEIASSERLVCKSVRFVLLIHVVVVLCVGNTIHACNPYYFWMTTHTVVLQW